MSKQFDTMHERSYHLAMPNWRCPHCGVPQEETARCWVCRRSSASCVTCRQFRRSIVAGVGYCGLDRRRAPLDGDEIRGCWESVAGSFRSAVPGLPVVIPPEAFWREPDI